MDVKQSNTQKNDQLILRRGSKGSQAPAAGNVRSFGSFGSFGRSFAATLTPESKASLWQLLRMARSHPGHIYIELPTLALLLAAGAAAGAAGAAAGASAWDCSSVPANVCQWWLFACLLLALRFPTLPTLPKGIYPCFFNLTIYVRCISGDSMMINLPAFCWNILSRKPRHKFAFPAFSACRSLCRSLRKSCKLVAWRLNIT